MMSDQVFQCDPSGWTGSLSSARRTTMAKAKATSLAELGINEKEAMKE